jgi:two-component system, LytTR family, response regulator
MISAVIIDDEQECINDLIYLINKLKLPVDIRATATTGNDALVQILRHKPQLVFLDVVMPGMSGFEMLDLLPSKEFQLIITTSVDKYAIQAIRASAIDFLLKPVKADELKEAVAKASEKTGQVSQKQLDLLSESMKTPFAALKRIALVIKDGVQLVDLDQIIFFKADGNYTTVYLSNGKEVVISKPIGVFEEMVSGAPFFRPHNSYLVNAAHVSKYIRSDGGYLVMDNQETIPVSRTKKELVMSVLAGL